MQFLGGTPTSICHFFCPFVCPSTCHVPYLRNQTSSNHNFWYTCVKWWYLPAFFHFFEVLILFHKTSVDLILKSPNLLLSDWSPVLHPLSFLNTCHNNSMLHWRDWKYHVGIHWYFIHQWLTILQLIQQKMDRGSKSILKMKLDALPSCGPLKTKGKLAQGTCLGESLENGKGGEVLPSTKKAKRSNKNKHLKNKDCYRSTSSSLSTEKSSPSPKRHKLWRKKCMHRKCLSSSSFSSLLSSSLESSETRSRSGLLGSQFQVISEEDKFRYNLPTDMTEYANTPFKT